MDTEHIIIQSDFGSQLTESYGNNVYHPGREWDSIPFDSSDEPSFTVDLLGVEEPTVTRLVLETRGAQRVTVTIPVTPDVTKV